MASDVYHERKKKRRDASADDDAKVASGKALPGFGAVEMGVQKAEF